MIKPLRLHVQNLRPLEAGPLAPHLASFAALLAQQRYCRVTGWNKLRLVAALSQWMVQTKLPVKIPAQRAGPLGRATERGQSPAPKGGWAVPRCLRL